MRRFITSMIYSERLRPSPIRAYLSLFRIRFINSLQYRLAAYAGVATQFAWGIMTVLQFGAFYRAGGEFPMEYSQLSSYIWLQQAFLALFMSWFFDNEIFALITGGNIAYELARPVDLYAMWFTKNAAIRCSKALLRCIPIIALAVFIPSPYGLSLPAGLPAFAMFCVTMALALCVVVAFVMLVYIATFYTMNPLGIRIIALSATDFFTGALIPLPFFPDRLRKIVELTPFASMQNLPLRIYCGDISGAELWHGVGLQIFWLVALIVLGRLWMNAALRRVIVQGG